jgi:hypothetical protein
MKFLGIGAPPPPPVDVTPSEDRFWHAHERNRRATIEARLTQRNLRQRTTSQEQTINELLRALDRQERGTAHGD